MNPITSTVAASCNRLVLSPRTSPRSSPRPSPNVVRKTPFLDLPNDGKKRRDSKEIEDYKKQLTATTRQAYKEKRTRSNNVEKGSNTTATKEKPVKRLLEEAVAQAATAEKQKHGKKTTNSKPSKSSSSSASTKDKKCTIMWLSCYLIVLSRTSHEYSAWDLSSAELGNRRNPLSFIARSYAKKKDGNHKKIQAAFVIKAEDFKLRCSRSSTGGSVLMNFELIGKCVIAPYETKSNTTWSLLIFSLT